MINLAAIEVWMTELRKTLGPCTLELASSDKQLAVQLKWSAKGKQYAVQLVFSTECLQNFNQDEHTAMLDTLKDMAIEHMEAEDD